MSPTLAERQFRSRVPRITRMCLRARHILSNLGHCSAARATRSIREATRCPSGSLTEAKNSAPAWAGYSVYDIAQGP